MTECIDRIQAQILSSAFHDSAHYHTAAKSKACENITVGGGT